MSEPAIEAAGLEKRYGDTVAIDGVAFDVAPGEVYAFLGPNGAGKTTTMGILTTLIEPTAGQAWIAGDPVSDRQAVRESIGYLPETAPIYEELTGREQLRYAARLRQLDRASAADRIDTLLAQFELAEDADRLIRSYSTGMRRKLGITQSLLHQPQVLFLDEPTSGLDPNARRSVTETIDRLTDRGTTVFLSTHLLEVAERIADRVGLLYDGRVEREGPPEEVTPETASLEELFVEVTG